MYFIHSDSNINTVDKRSNSQRLVSVSSLNIQYWSGSGPDRRLKLQYKKLLEIFLLFLIQGKSYWTEFHRQGVKMVSWKLSMRNTEQMLFLNVKLPTEHSRRLIRSGAHGRTDFNSYTLYMHSDHHTHSMQRVSCSSVSGLKDKNVK